MLAHMTTHTVCLCVCVLAQMNLTRRGRSLMFSPQGTMSHSFRQMKTWSTLKGTVNLPPLMEDVFTECPVTSLPTDVLFNTCRCIEKSSLSLISHLYLSFTL